MKTKDVLEWICRERISGSSLNIIDVPDESEGITSQTEEWWFDNLGACPPAPIEGGLYLYFYASDVEQPPTVNGVEITPDAECEVCNSGSAFDYDYILLYRLED